MSIINTVFANGLGTVSDDSLNSFVQTDQTAAQLRGFIGQTGMATLLQGLSAPGDNNGGMFYWSNGNYTDNGTSVIVPSGAEGAGAWLRANITPSTGLFLPLTGGTVSGLTTFSGASVGLAVTNGATFGGLVTGAGINALFSSPRPIGDVTPNTVAASSVTVTGGGPLGLVVQNTGANGVGGYASATIRTTGASGSGLGPGLYLDARSLPGGREYIMFSGGPGDGGGVGAGGLGLLDVSSNRTILRFDTDGIATFPQAAIAASLTAGNGHTYAFSGTQTTNSQYALLANGVMSGTSAINAGFDFALINVIGDTVNASPNFGGTNFLHVTGNVGAVPWTPSTSYPTLSAIANNGGRIYRVVVVGTSAGSGGPTGTGTNIIDGTVHWDYVSPDFSGSRAAIQAKMNIRGRNDPAVTNDGMRQWPAIIGTFDASSNQGGTAASSGLSAGFGFAGGDQAFLSSGATNWSGITGREIDVAIFTGASAASRICLALISFGNLQGNDVDSGLSFAATLGAPAFRRPIVIQGGFNFPVDAAGWFVSYDVTIGISAAGLTYVNPAMAGLIDASGLEFSSAFLRTTGGMSIGPVGQINAQSAVISTTGAITSIDTTGGELNTAVISGAGGSYKVGDHLYHPATGTIVNVSTIGGSGNVTLVSIVTKGHYAASAPANPVAFLGGTGAGATVTLTWTAGTTLSLQPTSGGLLRVGPSVMTANGSVATALSSVGPAGANTTVQEWFTVRNSSGTVRYIPAF